MVGGDDQGVVRLQFSKEFAQEKVGALQGPCVTGGIAAVAVEHIEINQVGEAEEGVWAICQDQEIPLGVGIVFNMEGFGDSAPHKNVVQLAHGDDPDSAFR